jgi:cytoskeleton protein RodZ
LPSFGEKLKLEREKRKITLEQISVSTKIGTRMLQALEEDKFSQLPGGIFNKGFVRAYSRFLGIDEDQTVADYLQASGDAPPPSTEIALREDGARENAENVRRLEAASVDDPPRPLPWGLFAALLLVVALALSLWSHRQRERERQSVQPTPTTAAMQVPAAQPSGEAPSGVPGGVPHKASGAVSPTPSAATKGLPNGGTASLATPIQPKDSTPQDLAASAPAPDEFTVLIKAREESWISITTDGTALSSEFLAAGSERTIRGRKEIVVKAGNAGGVDFRFNGRKLAFGGEFGEVKIVTFGPRGMLPAAPSPPANH